MMKFVLLAVILFSSVWGAPQTRDSVPMLDGRIVGGTNTTIQAHPYIVAVLEFGSHICGGSIIASNWVVSAAHCFLLTLNAYSVRAGSTFHNSSGQVVAASRVLLHANYSRSTLDFDIALIQLATAFTTPSAIPISLAAAGGAPLAGLTATITGWGALAENGVGSVVLQVVQVPIISQANCRAAYGQAAVTDRMFCAGLLGVGGRDACQGDSGGPLVASGTLTGIVSWGDGCARPYAPGVYSSIPNLRNWIRNISGV